MEDVLLTKEEQDAVSLIIDTIRKFEAGDESLEDDIIDIIRGILKFSKYSKRIKLQYKIIILFYHTISKINHFSDSVIEDSYSSVVNYYTLYCSSCEVLKKYLSVGFKTDEFPDLEAAYLLTIYLTNLEYNINDYLKEISSYEDSIAGGYSYYGHPKLKDKCEERAEVVKKLVSAISSKKNDEV